MLCIANKRAAGLSPRNWELIIYSDSKAIRLAFSKKLKSSFLSVFFPSEYDSGWVKEHGRLERCRLQRFEIDPENAGLCGCWQFVAVWRERQKLRKGKVVESSEEYVYYATSLSCQEKSPQQLQEIIRGHWGACENGAHYRRDVTLGEDASLIAKRTGAFVMATLRNAVLGLFELQKHRSKTTEKFLPGWLRTMTASQALKLIKQA